MSPVFSVDGLSLDLAQDLSGPALQVTLVKVCLESSKQTADIFIRWSEAIVNGVPFRTATRTLSNQVILHNAFADDHVPQQNLLAGPRTGHSTANACQDSQLEPIISRSERSCSAGRTNLPYAGKEYEDYEHGIMTSNPTDPVGVIAFWPIFFLFPFIAPNFIESQGSGIVFAR
ncbi:hypothetical protein Ct61P_08624 [Colletotrichum tofieldiae]|nr:hypothetical protein Ct61P_08624 [Colletotrichum tofieldiae]